MKYYLEEDILNGEYREYFKKIEMYAMTTYVDSKTMEEKMMDLLDIMSVAQEEGEPVSKVIGDDVEQFCEGFFSDYKMKDRIKNSTFFYIYRMCWIVFVLEILFVIPDVNESGFNLLNAKGDVSGYVLGIFCVMFTSFILNSIFKKIVFRMKKCSKGWYFLFDIIMSVILVCFGLKYFVKHPIQIPIFPVLVISGGYIVIYFVIRAIYRYQKTGSIKKMKEPFEQSWTGEMKVGIKDGLVDGFRKRYERINKRRVKRGKQEMTKEEYMQKIVKETKNIKYIDITAILVVMIFCVGLVIDVGMTSKIVDTIIFALILLVIELPIVYFFFIRPLIPSKSERIQLVNECEKLGICVVDYNKNESVKQVESEI